MKRDEEWRKKSNIGFDKTEKELEDILKEANEISKILATSIKNLKQDKTKSNKPKA